MKRITELQKEYHDAVRAVAPGSVIITRTTRTNYKIDGWFTHIYAPCPCKVDMIMQRKLHYLVNLYFAKVLESSIFRSRVPDPRRHHPGMINRDVTQYFRKFIFRHQ